VRCERGQHGIALTVERETERHHAILVTERIKAAR
jgi:hypothetical protein